MLHLYMDKFHLIDTTQFKQIITNVRKDLISVGEMDKRITLTEFKETIAIELGKVIGFDFKNYAHFIKQIELCKKSPDYDLFRAIKEHETSNGGYLLSITHLLVCQKYKITPRIAKAIVDRHIGRTQKKSIFVVYQGKAYSADNIEQFQRIYNSLEKEIVVMCLAHDEKDALTIFNTEIVRGVDTSSFMRFIDTTENGDIFARVPGHLLPGDGFRMHDGSDDNTQLLFPNEAISYQLERLAHNNAEKIRNVFRQAFTDSNFRMRVYLDEMTSDLLLDDDFAVKVRVNFCFELLLEQGCAYGPGNGIYGHFTQEEYPKALYVEELIREGNQIFSYLTGEGKMFQLNFIAHDKDFFSHLFRDRFFSLQEAVCMTTEDMNLEKIEEIFDIPNMRKYLSKEFQKKYTEEKQLSFFKQEITA